MQTEEQDDEMIAGICRGEEAALKALARKYCPHLFKFAVSILHRPELAEEAVANVFISIWQRRETLAIGTNARNYLFTAAGNHALKLLRTEVHPQEISIDDVPPDKLLEDMESGHELKCREFMEEIDALLKTMPEERQQVFKMHRLENLRYKEIAAALGISVNVVQKHMDIARKQIEAARVKLIRRLRRD